MGAWTMADAEEEKKNRPDDSDFKQQRLKAWQPILTPMWVIITFAGVGIIFMIIGVLVLVASNEVVEYTSDAYEALKPNSGSCKSGEGSSSTSCMVTQTIEIEKDMDAPIYMYYQLSNFYQNHRRYVKSRSDIQLRGDGIDTTTGCDPLSSRACENNNKVKGTCAVYPCGLIAWSVFNDTFYETSSGPSAFASHASSVAGKTCTDSTSCVSVTVPKDGKKFDGTTCNTNGGCAQTVPWDSDGIAWSSDKEKKFIALSPTEATTPSKKTTDACTESSCIAMPYDSYKYFRCVDTTYSKANGNLDSCPKEKKYADVGNEEFIVWMRTSGLPDFRKLHRIIHTDLKAGSKLTFHINNIFPVMGFDGKKKIVLSTTTWIGGKNQFLGWAYIVVATVCILLAIGFGIKQAIDPRQVGKASDLERES